MTKEMREYQLCKYEIYNENMQYIKRERPTGTKNEERFDKRCKH
jgi:hypothetical protein